MREFRLKKEIIVLAAISLIFILLKCTPKLKDHYIFWPYLLMLIALLLLILSTVYKIQILNSEKVVFYRILGSIVINPRNILKIEKRPRHYEIYLNSRKIKVGDWINDSEAFIQNILELNDKIIFEELSISNIYKDWRYGHLIVFSMLISAIVLCIAIFLLISGYLSN